MARHAIVVALPSTESDPVCAELALAGFEAISVDAAFQLEAVLDSRRDVAVVILDSELDVDASLGFQTAVRDAGRAIPTLTVVTAADFERLLVEDDGSGNEYLTRPYSADSIRWRIEAMCIRRETVDDGSGPVLADGQIGTEAWSRRATLIAVFNPKGGVGKTTVATNLANARPARASRCCSSTPTR